MYKKIWMLFVTVLAASSVCAQIENSSTEVLDYKEIDGRIIIPVMVNGIMADFVLDLAGHNALLPEFVDKLRIDHTKITTFGDYNTHQYKTVGTNGVYPLANVSVGNAAFGTDVKFFILNDEPYLRELGVAGVIGGSLFSNSVLTIDAKNKKLTVTVPYRPNYMKLENRISFTTLRGVVPQVDILIDNQPFTMVIDTWNRGIVSLTATDYARLSRGKSASIEAVISIGYGKDSKAERQTTAANLKFGKVEITSGVRVAENNSLQRSALGLDLLQHGVISIDYAKQKIYFQPHDAVQIDYKVANKAAVSVESGKLNAITKDYFVEHIFDYRKGGAFVSKSDKPIIIDFWATWCGPCMRLLPQMETLAAKYKDQVVFLKVNADKEKELCAAFEVRGLPTLFFIPAGGAPIVEMGISAEKITQIIEEKLIKK